MTLPAIIGFWHAASWTDHVIYTEQSYSQLSCNDVGKIYLNQDNDEDNLADYYLYLNSNFVLNQTAYDYSAGQILRGTSTDTKVIYYRPLANMLYKIDENGNTGSIDNNLFWRASRVMPYNTPVRGIATSPNKVVFEQPSDNNPNKNIVGFVYDYQYKYATKFASSGISPYRYNSIPNINYYLNTWVTLVQTLPWANGNRTRVWSSVQNTQGCKNYELHRCGDGIVQSWSDSSWVNQFSWEICDEWSLNGTPGHCPINCGLAATERCGDETLQPAGTYYNGNTNDMSFEECDDGDATGDTDWVLNGDDPATAFCSSICLPTFSEAFTEEFVNG